MFCSDVKPGSELFYYQDSDSHNKKFSVSNTARYFCYFDTIILLNNVSHLLAITLETRRKKKKVCNWKNTGTGDVPVYFWSLSLILYRILKNNLDVPVQYIK
jgi:hypothetical protein